MGAEDGRAPTDVSVVGTGRTQTDFGLENESARAPHFQGTPLE